MDQFSLYSCERIRNATHLDDVLFRRTTNASAGNG